MHCAPLGMCRHIYGCFFIAWEIAVIVVGGQMRAAESAFFIRFLNVQEKERSMIKNEGIEK